MPRSKWVFPHPDWRLFIAGTLLILTPAWWLFSVVDISPRVLQSFRCDLVQLSDKSSTHHQLTTDYDTSVFALTVATSVGSNLSTAPPLIAGGLVVRSIVDDIRDDASCGGPEFFLPAGGTTQCKDGGESRPLSQFLLKTTSGLDARDLIQAALGEAWGKYPPSVDIYVRTGCALDGYGQLFPLVKSIELFWPHFLGKIVFVLDAGDTEPEGIIPKDTFHKYEFHFEQVPKHWPGKSPHQVSYLHADKHCSAEFIVTFESDCVLFLPVFPQLIFRDYGSQQQRLVLGKHKTWQSEKWFAAQAAIYKDDMGNDTYMVSQPVTFRRDSFIKLREYYAQMTGTCLALGLSQIVHSVPEQQFCWMCVVGAFVDLKGNDRHKYEVVDHSDPLSSGMMRFAGQMTSEARFRCNDHLPIALEQPHHYRADAMVAAGLCLALGTHRTPGCIAAVWPFHEAPHQSMFTYSSMSVHFDSHVRAKLALEYFAELNRMIDYANAILPQSPIEARPRSG